MASTDATPQPIKGQALRITFPLWLTTGAVNAGASGLDSEISIDNGGTNDCTNEAAELTGMAGRYYLDLTNDEMNGDTISVRVKSSTTNAINAEIDIYPNSLGKTQVDVQSIFGVQQVAPGAAGGLFIAGTNAATEITGLTVTGSFGITSSFNIGSQFAVSGAVTFSSGFVANAITGTLATVTNLTNLPSIPANWLTATGIASGAITSAKFATGALDAVWATAARTLTAGTNIVLPSNGLSNVSAWTVAITGNITGNLSGSVGSVTAGVTVSTLGAGSIATATFAVGATIPRVTLADTVTTVTGLTASNLDATISSRLAASAYTAPDNTSITAIKTKTDFLPSVTAGQTNGLVIAGSNAATTFVSISTGAMNINGVGNIAQTGDSYIRIGATGSGLTSLATTAQAVKLLAAVYDSATLSGSTLTLSNAATMTVSSTGRITT